MTAIALFVCVILLAAAFSAGVVVGYRTRLVESLIILAASHHHHGRLR